MAIAVSLAACSAKNSERLTGISRAAMTPTRTLSPLTSQILMMAIGFLGSPMMMSWFTWRDKTSMESFPCVGGGVAGGRGPGAGKQAK